jgi:hypothetical protein
MGPRDSCGIRLWCVPAMWCVPAIRTAGVRYPPAVPPAAAIVVADGAAAPPGPATVSVDEAAALLGRDRSRVYALVRAGELGAARG